jgi:hypothetical protein
VCSVEVYLVYVLILLEEAFMIYRRDENLFERALEEAGRYTEAMTGGGLDVKVLCEVLRGINATKQKDKLYERFKDWSYKDIADFLSYLESNDRIGSEPKEASVVRPTERSDGVVADGIGKDSAGVTKDVVGAKAKRVSDGNRPSSVEPTRENSKD